MPELLAVEHDRVEVELRERLPGLLPEDGARVLPRRPHVIHAGGVVRQVAAAVRDHDLQLRKTLQDAIEHEVADGDGVHGGLVAGVQQEHAGADQLVLGQALALLNDGGQGADQVLVRMGPALPRKGSEVIRELHARSDGAACVPALAGRPPQIETLQLPPGEPTVA